MSLIEPHGGKLVNREVKGGELDAFIKAAANLPRLTINARAEADVELISNGAFSPLEGFMSEADYVSVRDNRRLANGLVWTIPVTLSITDDDHKRLKPGNDVALHSVDGRLIAVIHSIEIYQYDKELEAEKVYLTKEDKHPGVKAVYSQGEYLISGKITKLSDSSKEFASYRYTPRNLRSLFAERGWTRVVAFQTRNPVHRAHEYIQKCALETVDALLLHPIVGETKSDDIPAPLRMKSYEAIIENYYPLSRTQLAVLPAAMRYAGPREAIFHAIIRKNYGCTHFIVGRDHAGVGNYYGTYDAQQIFGDFKKEEIGITPMFFENTFYCRRCDGMASLKTCPHESVNHVSLSGTKVREMLSNGEVPPGEFTRPEVAEVLISGLRTV